MAAKRVFFALQISGVLLAFNVLASPIKTDESVQFFPSIGIRNRDGSCDLEIRGWVFEKEWRPGVTTLFGKYIGVDSSTLTPIERARFSERTRLFLVDAEKGKKCSIEFQGRSYTLPASDATGHFQGRLRLEAGTALGLSSSDSGVQPVSFRAILPRGDERSFTGSVMLMPPSGISVISDVDDTIRASEVGERQALLVNTFVKPLRPVPGMAEFYQSLSRKAGASFHYVSASPSQLYPVLSEFVQSNAFPAGSFHLRPLQWKKGFFQPGSAAVREFKEGQVEALLRNFPERRWILVGDSGELDPEIYGKLARRYPDHVGKIIIRATPGAPPSDSGRYSAAFRGLPAGVWQVFTNASEIEFPRLR